MPDTPPRHLGLQGASNFRDLGGYPGSDGRRVRWRRLFRSNHLGQLTDTDIAIVRQLGIRSAFDFRGHEERSGGLCTIAEIAVRSLPIEPSVVPALRERAAAGRLSVDVALDLMRESYRNYIRRYTQHFRALFEHLLENPAPLVIHCTAGKDRTGVACALLLHALGVPQEIILEDYLLTNQLYGPTLQPITTFPSRFSRRSERSKLLFWRLRSAPRGAISAISMLTCAKVSALARRSAKRCRTVILRPEASAINQAVSPAAPTAHARSGTSRR